MSKRENFPRRVLISGASVAGLTTAYWLDRFGFDVTLVERASTVRSGGYPIDVRGTAIGVLEKMSLAPQVRSEHIDSRSMTFVNGHGQVIGTIPPYVVMGNEIERDVELPRGALTGLIYGFVKESRVTCRFRNSIEALDDDGASVSVLFEDGVREKYDVVIGADGLHSRTRQLAFGPEDKFSHYLGYCFNLFTMPNDLRLAHEAITYAEPGRAAGMIAVRESHDVFAFLIFATENPGPALSRDLIEQRRLTEAVYAESGWQVPKLLNAMSNADDLYFDSVSQIRMSNWAKGRVGLVGDAAYAPSFLSGQGTSLALVGAYVLAGELASHFDPVEGFMAYEKTIRPYVEANQALATGQGSHSFFLPRTPEEIEQRDEMLIRPANGETLGAASETSVKAYNQLELPKY